MNATDQTGESNGDGGDQYTGCDRFGLVCAKCGKPFDVRCIAEDAPAFM